MLRCYIQQLAFAMCRLVHLTSKDLHIAQRMGISPQLAYHHPPLFYCSPLGLLAITVMPASAHIGVKHLDCAGRRNGSVGCSTDFRGWGHQSC